ncbi:MAG: hypothetical protein H5T69_00680 [Chloroflexi bacterium]|nr:hypothetical protein [Chloroflexota bacterium]
MKPAPGFWRELYIRVGMTTILAAIAYFILGVDIWIWAIPVGVSALVLAKWLLRPPEAVDPDDQEQP